MLYGEEPPIELRGLCQLWHTGTGAERRIGLDTTSSSSAASADEPSGLPAGLGEQRTGDSLPELDEEVEASPFTAGRAIGAIGTFGRVIGPGSAADSDDMRRGGWMAEPGLITGEVTEVGIPPAFGGPIGAGGPRPRPKL